MSVFFAETQTAKNFIVTDRNGKSKIVEVPITFEGDIQPLSSRQIVSLTNGRLSSGMIDVFSETQLIVSTEGSGGTSKGTYVLFEGKWYECVSETSWNTSSAELSELNHYEYTAEYRGLNGV